MADSLIRGYNMFKNKSSGKFIAIEGLDGSGSSTQSHRLYYWLKEKKLAAWLTQEPTATIIGGIIKSCLVGDWKNVDPKALQLLFAADRADHLEYEIKPRLEKGVNVITDRYFLSSIAYGSTSASEQWLMAVNDLFILPDLTLLLKVPVRICLERIKESRTGFELFEKKDKLEKVWSVYEAISKKYPNIMIIDGEKSEEEVFKDVREAVDKII